MPFHLLIGMSQTWNQNTFGNQKKSYENAIDRMHRPVAIHPTRVPVSHQAKPEI